MKTYYKGLALLSIICIFTLLIYGINHLKNNTESTNEVVANVVTWDILKSDEVSPEIVSDDMEGAIKVGSPEIDNSEVILESYVEDLPLGSLFPERLVLTVGESPMTAVGLTFSLATEGDVPTIVIVLDENEQWVGDYITEAQTFEAQLGDTSEVVRTYKTTMNRLNGGSNYTYFIQQGEAYSDLYEFRTLDEEANTTIGFFGDIQGYKLSQYEDFAKVYDKALSDSGGLDLSIIAGDIVDTGSHFEEWLYLDEAMSAYMSHQLFATAIGNHDVIGDSDNYTATFNYPDNGVEGLEERSYYFDLPQARIAYWDTEALSTFDQQAQWLEGIMAEATQAFKIVVMHRSVYPMAYDEGHIRPLAEVFDAAGIDLVISGHDHIYSRTTMSKDKKVNLNQGVTYVVGGSGSGSKYYEAIFPESRYWSEFYYDDNQPVYSIIELSTDQINFTAKALVDNKWQSIDTFIIRRKGAK